VKVHRELLDHQKLPPRKHGNSFWKARYDDINAFERHLVRNGIVVLKFCSISLPTVRWENPHSGSRGGGLSVW